MIPSSNNLIFLPEDFIQKTENDKRLVYSDTDSAYLIFDLPFNKFEDIRKLVDYIQGLSKKIDNTYNEALNYYVGKFGGMNPAYNTMKFKSEVVAYQGFFNTKKFYALSKAWDEGTFFSEPKIKKTGGQIKKADVTKISEKLLNNVYKILVIPSETKDLLSLYKKIFIETKNSIKMELKKDIDELNFNSFGVPKKWGFKATRATMWVTGARLYNQICEDLFRPGDSMIMIPIKGEFNQLKDYIVNGNENNEFALREEDTKDLKALSIPPNMTTTQKEKLAKALELYRIQVNFDEVMSFNIDMKLEVFEKLFPAEIKLKI
jgi:hypothetical protein